nr:pyridoxal-dependent decarboxylase [uncultured Cohaesibacter sp.]
MNNQKMDTLEETLDPLDWKALQDLAHHIVDDAVAHIKDVRTRPVWQEMPADVRVSFTQPAPLQPKPLSDIYAELKETLLPYSMGNIHPRFWMWFMGSGSFTGALAEFLASVDGSNLGAGNTSAALIDRQVVNWLKQMMGFPESASGTLVSGGSMANIIGLTTARNAMAGIDVRAEGITALPKQLRFYASDQVHSCHQQAVELLGMGNNALRRVPSNPDFTINISALKKMISEDRSAGHLPACVIATAGTVNTGAIDDLPSIAALCKDEQLWFHVDGCIGALVAIAPKNHQLVNGIEKADSLALDPHKWLHVPFEAGCALIRDANTHRNTFALHPEYLENKPRGIAAAEYLHDYNLQTSRAFRALKVWLAIKEQGVEKFGRLIDQNIAQAHYLSRLIGNTDQLHLMAPTTINIVCFRYVRPAGTEAKLRELNMEIMLQMQESGIAAISDTTVEGHHCLRIAICNHRTRYEDLDLLVDEVLRIGDQLTS